ncbi:MAG: hypothetical protein AcusKO_19960 [Acuticoccus sp.]
MPACVGAPVGAVARSRRKARMPTDSDRSMMRRAVACGTGAEPSGSNVPGGIVRVSQRISPQAIMKNAAMPTSQRGELLRSIVFLSVAGRRRRAAGGARCCYFCAACLAMGSMAAHVSSSDCFRSSPERKTGANIFES